MTEPVETTLTDRLQALATELEGQMKAAEAAGASPPEELSSAKRMMTDLLESAAILMMVDGLLNLIHADGAADVGAIRDQASAIQERMQYADPEP